MGPAETAAPPRWAWLDRWLEPPWRALLTWMVLAAVSAAVEVSDWARSATDMMRDGVSQWAGTTHVSVPAVFYSSFNLTGGIAIVAWFPPLLLRLGLWRWVLWMCGATLTQALFDFSWIPNSSWRSALYYCAWPALAGMLLVGRRNRPWMPLPAGALSLMTLHWAFDQIYYHSWLWLWPLGNLPYAALMLFGTRRLPRAEDATPEA